MLKKYSKILAAVLIVFALFAFSALVVSADYNNYPGGNGYNNYDNGGNQGGNNGYNGGDNNGDQGSDNQGSDNDGHHPQCTPSPTPTPKPENFHYACNSDKVCAKVEGTGDNTCSSDWDCKSKITPTPSVTPTVTPSVTPTPTQAPSNNTNTGGPGDGRSDNLGCSTHDCSGNVVGSPSQAVLGASTGPQVLGLSYTSGNEVPFTAIAQLILASLLSISGFTLLRKNA